MNILNDYIDSISTLDQSTACQVWEANQIKSKISWSKQKKLILNLAADLQSRSIGSGDHVAILGHNSFEWMIADFAILYSGAISTPIHVGISQKDLSSILTITKPKLLFIEKDLYKHYQEVFALFDFIEFQFIDHISKKNLQKNDSDHAKFINPSPNLDDIVTIVFTSGTTGEPKAVPITHRQIISQISSLSQVLHLNENDETLTILPFSHVFARIQIWGHLTQSYKMNFIDSNYNLKFYFSRINPTFLLLVPLAFEKIFSEIKNSLQKNKASQLLLKQVLKNSKKVSLCKQLKQIPKGKDLFTYLLASKTLYKKVNQFFGHRLKYCISSGAKLNEDTLHFFHAANVKILEAWGLTETQGALTLNRPHNFKIGSVGKVVNKNLELKIQEDGEVLVHDSTNHLNTFATGDTGYIDDDGFLYITGRKKDLIKTSSGKYVSPQKLSQMLKPIDSISHVIISGDDKNYIVALISLNFEKVKKFALKNKISFQNLEVLSKNKKVFKFVEEEIEKVNQSLEKHEQIRNFSILPRELTIDDGELTPTLKLKRKFCLEKFKNEIDSLYPNLN